LLQEAARLNIRDAPCTDAAGRRETSEDARIRSLIEQEVTTPHPDPASCRRYFDNNRRRFRTPDRFACAHILFAASADEPQAYAAARRAAEAVIAQLRRAPERFAELARAHSVCPSAPHGGILGEISADQVTPEFQQALEQLAPGAMTMEPIPERYGFHIIWLDRRVAGSELPFAAVVDRIAEYLTKSVEQRAFAQYIARLAAHATLEGITLADAETLRVH
jgi:peptidyl-prolyl cis-trans isomerase C